MKNNDRDNVMMKAALVAGYAYRMAAEYKMGGSFADLSTAELASIFLGDSLKRLYHFEVLQD